jgi:hypothetical protein
MIPKRESRFPACAKPSLGITVMNDASAGEGRSDQIMRKAISLARDRTQNR